MSNINKPAVKPILLGKKIIFKPDKVPTIGSDSLVTSGALAEALQNKNVALNDSSDNIIPTGDIIVGRLGEDSAFYIINPNFLGTKWMKLETLETGKLYYDKFTHTYYTFQGYIVENEEKVGYKFEPLVLPSIVKVTWQELKDLRDNSKLIPGLKYRITDYQCTTTQENTKSAGHQFDIVLLALDNKTLAEEGWAMEHPTDVYDVTFSDGVTKKCYIYKLYVDSDTEYNIVDCTTKLGVFEVILGDDFTLNEENKTAIATFLSTKLSNDNLTYEYFQNCNLSAWKVWYCLDNDTSRFTWADATNGKGVIYRLIDEWNNDVPYDFKNIMKLKEAYDVQADYYYLFNSLIVNGGEAESYVNDSTVLDLGIFPKQESPAIPQNNKIYRCFVRYEGQDLPLQHLTTCIDGLLFTGVTEFINGILRQATLYINNTISTNSERLVSSVDDFGNFYTRQSIVSNPKVGILDGFVVESIA